MRGASGCAEAEFDCEPDVTGCAIAGPLDVEGAGWSAGFVTPKVTTVMREVKPLVRRSIGEYFELLIVWHVTLLKL